jgi:hypothetical protein
VVVLSIGCHYYVQPGTSSKGIEALKRSFKALTFSIGLYCTVFSLKVCNKVAHYFILFYFIAHVSTLLKA